MTDGVTPAPRRPFELADAVAAAGLVALGLAISARQLGDFDLPMHVATGRFIRATHTIPGVDPFSSLHGDVRYVELASVALFSVALDVLGPLGLQAVGGLSAVAVALALHAQTRRFGPAGLLATALAVAGVSSFFVVRSSALSFPLLALTTWALDAHRRAPGAPAGRRALLAYVGLMLAWANTHGSVTLGALLGAVHAGHRVACRLARGRAGPLLPAGDGAGAGAAVGAFVAGLVAASLNTAGPHLLLGPLRFGGKLAELGTFTEWAPPSWSFFIHHEPVALAALGAALVAAAAGRDAEGGARVPALYDAVLAAGAVLAASTAVRLVPLAVILLAPWTARRLALRLPFAGRTARLACAGASLLAVAPVLASPLPFGVGFDARHLPEGASRWIEAHRPSGRLWNSPSLGGYLTMRLWPAVHVLMDGRNGLAYALSDVDEVGASERDPAVFAALASRLDLDWAVVLAFEPRASGLPIAESPDWAMAFLDDAAAVYVRRGGPDASLADPGYLLLRHTTEPGALLSFAIRGGSRAPDLARDGALALAQAPGSARARIVDACGALAIRDVARFDRDAAGLAATEPGHPALGALAAARDAVLGATSADPR